MGRTTITITMTMTVHMNMIMRDRVGWEKVSGIHAVSQPSGGLDTRPSTLDRPGISCVREPGEEGLAELGVG